MEPPVRRQSRPADDARPTRRWAWSAALLASAGLAMALATFWLTWTTRRVELPPGFEGGLPLALMLALLLFVGAGGLVAVKRPDNLVGWALLAIGLSWQTVGLAGVVRIATFAAGSTSAWAAWVWDVLWIPGIALVPVLFVLFPDGRPPSRRWRAVLGLVIGGSGLLIVGLGLRAGPLWNTPVDNPIGVGWVDPAAGALEAAGNGMLVVAVLASLAAPVVRFRRADRMQRYQLKWFLAAAVVVVGAWAVAGLLQAMGTAAGTLALVRMTPVAALPVAVAVAVLRYRLYDIDRLVSRTVSYAALTLVLGGIYALGVLGVGGIVTRLTGGGSELVVAASTLTVAAAFRPIRARIQSGVDRRFSRARYDAQQTVARFAQQLRTEVDLSPLVAHLAATVRTTMGPERVSVWLAIPDDAHR